MDRDLYPDFPVPTVASDDNRATWTGLYNADGDRLMRAPRPIGFHSPPPRSERPKA